jgi:hypothetical protein
MLETLETLTTAKQGTLFGLPQLEVHSDYAHGWNVSVTFRFGTFPQIRYLEDLSRVHTHFKYVVSFSLVNGVSFSLSR